MACVKPIQPCIGDKQDCLRDTESLKVQCKQHWWPGGGDVNILCSIFFNDMRYVLRRIYIYNLHPCALLLVLLL